MSTKARIAPTVLGAGVILIAVLGCGRDAEEPLPPAATTERIEVIEPRHEAVFPPEFVPPTFLWRDSTAADSWRVSITFDGDEAITATADGLPPPRGEIDPDALGATNEIYERPDASMLHAWTPPAPMWEDVQRQSAAHPATITIDGYAGQERLSSGVVVIRTSRDPVGAPIFYRDVPLMPAEGKHGVIQPLARGAIPLIAWRLRDVSQPESKVVLKGMPSCANCHSFSKDGSTLAMDVDGPQGDKGTYAIAPVAPEMVIDSEQVITWNSFPDKPEGHKTIGFLSRISPDGKHALTTVNEELYVANFTNYRFLQVFYPTRGILAWYSTDTKEMKALPGADDPDYVHCNPVWSPDGKWIVFSRAEAIDAYEAGKPLAARPNDPNETRIRYDLHRIPFNAGRGGTAEPIPGASDNGMSNTFPKVSPDGRWIVYTQCKNGQLMRPDGRLRIVPFEGGEAREMRCNTELMNSWHSFSPNGRWMVFSSKSRTPYTQMFLTHLDEEGNDSPAVLVPNATAANRAVNIPEFANVPYEGLDRIEVPAVNHHRHLWDALEFLRRKAYAEAIPHLEKALAEDPEFSRALLNLGLALIETGRAEEAFAPLERALRADPTSDVAHHNLGLAHSRLKHWDEAEKHYRDALERNPGRALTLNNLGFVLAQQKRWDDALVFYERALERDRELAMAWRNMAQALFATGRRADALSCYRRAAEREPDDAGTQRALGGLLLGTGAIPEAVAHLERATELDAEDWESRVQLAWVRATSWLDDVRDGRQAISLAEEACRLTAREKPGPLDVLAAAYAEAGRFEEAVETLRGAAKLAESDGPGAKGLAPGWEARLKRYESGRPYRERPRGP